MQAYWNEVHITIILVDCTNREEIKYYTTDGISMLLMTVYSLIPRLQYQRSLGTAISTTISNITTIIPFKL